MLIIISSSYHLAYILTGPLCGISTPPLPLVFFSSSSSSLPSLSTIVLSFHWLYLSIFSPNPTGTTHHGVAQSGPVSGSFRHGFPRVKVAYQYNNSSQCTRMTGVRFGSSVLNLFLSVHHGGVLYIRASLCSVLPWETTKERTHRNRNETESRGRRLVVLRLYCHNLIWTIPAKGHAWLWLSPLGLPFFLHPR